MFTPAYGKLVSRGPIAPVSRDLSSLAEMLRGVFLASLRWRFSAQNDVQPDAFLDPESQGLSSAFPLPVSQPVALSRADKPFERWTISDLKEAIEEKLGYKCWNSSWKKADFITKYRDIENGAAGAIHAAAGAAPAAAQA